MMDISVKNALFAGMGPAAYTYDKSANVVHELVKAGELTIGQAEDLEEGLKNNFRPRTRRVQHHSMPASERLQELMPKLDSLSYSDLEALKKQIELLQRRKH